MIRPISRSAPRLHALLCTSTLSKSVSVQSALLSTQSGDDAQRPTALTKLYLEDGTVLTGKSFGCHTAVEGEVSRTGRSNFTNILPALRLSSR
jgi:hypothetical protein